MNRVPTYTELLQRYEELEQRMNVLEKSRKEEEQSLVEIAIGILEINTHLPKTVQWMPGVQEALKASKEICDRIAAKRYAAKQPDTSPPRTPPPSEPRAVSAADTLLPDRPGSDPRIPKMRKL